MSLNSLRIPYIFIIFIAMMSIDSCIAKQANTNEMEFFVGSISRTIVDKENNLSYPVWINYPTLEKSKPTKFGPYSFDVAIDGKLKNGKFPLVVISHGNSGSHLIYHTISSYLVKKGYIVVSLEHYGNNRNNNELEKSDLNLVYRPKHISLTIDYLLSDESFGPIIDKHMIAIIGHSFGGYSALAVAGGKPWSNTGKMLKIDKDARVKAIVLMSPAAGYFASEDALEEVNIPIFLLTAEHDQFTQKQWCEDVIFNGIRDQSLITHKEIKNAGHFSFISPFPAHMKNPNFLPSTDPEGFNREEFHQQLPVEIYNYLIRYPDGH